jgi:oxalate---CoA ligase
MTAVATRTRGAVAARAPEPDLPLSDVIRARSVLLGDRSYIEHARAGGTLTFRQLEEHMDRWRNLLGGIRTRGLSTIGLVVGDPVAFADAFLGAISAGFWVAPLDPAMPVTGGGGLELALARTGVDVVVADRPAPVGVNVAWVELDRLDDLEDGRVTRPGATAPQRADAGGIVLSSSGTTGPPKVVRLGQDKLLHAARNVASHLQLGPEDRGFNPLPLFHINAEVVGVLSTLVAGSSLVLDDRFHRSGFWDLMARRSITWINAVPAIVSRLSALGPDESVPRRIRFIRSASAPLPVAVADQFEASTGIPVIETYGMTEAASQITAHPLFLPRRPGSVGLPVGVELRIVRQTDPVGTPLEAPEFHIGHVEIRGVSVVESYVGGTHADNFSSDGWMRTGDLGHRDADGFLYLHARVDDVINRGGEKVLPREVEEAIGADSMIASVAVVGRDDPELGQVPVAYVVLRAVAGDDGSDHAASRLDAAEAADRIKKTLERDLVRAKRPVSLSVVERMPVGPTGKVKRRLLGSPEAPVLFTFDLR